VRAQLRGVLVAGEGALGGGRALHQNPAGTAAIDGVEIVAVLDLRAIGITELFVDGFLLGQFLVTFKIHGDVVRRAGPKGPATGRAIRLVHQSYRLGGTPPGDLEAMEL